MSDAASARKHVARDEKPCEGAEPGDIVKIRNLSKRFQRGDGSIVSAIEDVSLDVRPGEFVVLLGPSGCGKTTLLRAIAGLEQPDSGSIDIYGQTVYSSEAGFHLSPEARRLSMIFQSYALWPHMTAFNNVGYPLEARGVATRDIALRVNEALSLVGIPELAGQYPSQMSGGQQQRVALARAVVSRDQLVLFDEPLSNVDAKVRQQLRLELIEMQRKLSFAAVYVTHDQIEAMALAHRIAVLRDGKIEQIGAAMEIYNEPASRYVANFIGVTNEIPAKVVRANAGGLVVECRLGRLAIGSSAAGFAEGAAVHVLVRPEHLRMSTNKPVGDIAWRGVVTTSVFLGPYTENIIRVDDAPIQVWTDHAAPLPVGADVWITPDSTRLRVVPT